MKGMRGKSQATFKGLRRGLLALLLVALGVLLGLYFLGRQGAPGEESAASAPTADGAGDATAQAATQKDNVVASSAAFDYTQAVEGQPVFNVHGDRFLTTRDGKVELEGVRFEVFRGAVSYSVASDTATYDSNSQEALLAGNVQLAGSGMTIASGQMQLSRGGKFLAAAGPIALRQGAYWTGQASALEFDVALDLVRMLGPVVISGRLPGAEPVEMHAGRVVLNRSARMLRARGAVSVRRGASHFASEKAELFLAEDGETPVALVLDGSLTGSYAAGPGADAGERVDFQGARLTVEFGAGGAAEAREMRFESGRKRLAVIASVAGEVTREVASRALALQLVAGRPRTAQSSVPVHFAEYLRGVDAPLRSGRADRAEVEFGDTGGIVRVVLAGGVTLADPKFRGWGEQALFDFADERSELLGEPARTEGESGELSAPHVVYARKTGLLTADRGVRGVLQRGRGGAASTLQGVGFRDDLPVEFQADEAIFADAPRRFLLKGKVRAWQGRSLLLADQLHGEEAEQRLSAAGGVRTLIPLRQEASSPPAGTAAAAPAPAATPPMTEVVADLLTYRRNEATVTYTGGVRLSEGVRTLTCEELVAELDGAQRVRRMVGSGKIVLQDPTAGRSVQGNTAIYDVAAETIELSGDPVTMKDDSGATLSGKRVLYDLKSGSARVAGAAQ